MLGLPDLNSESSRSHDIIGCLSRYHEKLSMAALSQSMILRCYVDNWSAVNTTETSRLPTSLFNFNHQLDLSDRLDKMTSVMQPRLATLNNVEQITDTYLLSFPDDAHFSYRYPYRQEYPNDHGETPTIS